MNLAASPATGPCIHSEVAAAAYAGLTAQPKHLPAWLFYDEAGSQLFEEITELPEYYLTRTERAILRASADEMISLAAGEDRLRIGELGAGSADKTRLLLQAAVARQETVVYEPLDVSPTALDVARDRIQREIPEVHVLPRVRDYMHTLDFAPAADQERRMVLYIGSSIGNFDPHEAAAILRRVRAALQPGDSLLLGVDLVKDVPTLLAAYNDAAGINAAFNRNILVRLNRELSADFDPEAFAHLALWNPDDSRIEMHLVSRAAQRVRIEALDLDVEFAAGETLHTENSYKYTPGKAHVLLAEAGFAPEKSWTDPCSWFCVSLGIAG